VGPGRVSAARRIGASRSGGCARRGISLDGIFESVGGMTGGGEVFIESKKGILGRLDDRRGDLVPEYEDVCWYSLLDINSNV